MFKLKMNTSTPYEIIIEDGLLVKVSSYISNVFNGKNVFVITDTRVAQIYLEKVYNALTNYNVKSIIIEGYEEAKCISEYTHILEELIALGATRGDLLVALGGGVIGDLTGFVAATLFRGIDFIQIPTTFLAQIDSSIGGKTGIDFLGHKNIVGAFKQPKLVLIDPLVLNTLPTQELKNGYGEAIKHALIGDESLFNLLETGNITEEVIYKNLLVKKHFVEADEFDKDKRMILNFGHTFGHAYELDKNIPHGKAVLSGMLVSLDLSIKLGFAKPILKDNVLDLYKKLSLEYENINYNEYVNVLTHDKKNISGTLNLILINDFEKPFIFPVSEEDICEL